ncbi:MAG: ankyrin repeat domain-containing protein [Acidobacteriia bacterium]|nr:ankyrin repeat domain-containing protein [Terriglobia bacterium]
MNTNAHKFAVAILGFATILHAADTRIADAAQNGDLKAVRALIGQKADVNGAQGDGSTALHWAAQKDDVELAKVLLEAKAKIDVTTRLGAATPLFMACRSGNAAIIELLIKAGAEVNSPDEHGTTPLMMAAAAGNRDAVKVLIDHGANVNAREGVHGQTALMFAAALGRADAIRVLAAHGADPSITSKAAKAPHIPSTFEQIQNGAQRPGATEKPAAPASNDKGSNDKEQLNALAAGLGFKSAEYRAGGPEATSLQATVQKLMAKVDELEKKLPGGAKPADDGMFRPPRERGASEVGGMTALLFAARDGQMDAAKALIEAGANVNQQSAGDKSTPIVMAAANGHFDLAKFFLDYGADPNLANDLGLTPLYAAIDLQWSPKGWFPSPDISQEKTGYLAFMSALLDAGANPNARIAKKLWFRTSGDHSWIDTAGSTAFLRAAQSLDLTAMRLLLAHGADPDLATTGGDTPLMVACGMGWGYHYSVNSPEYTWMEAVKFLMQLGGDVNAADARGYTPLHAAAYIGNDELIQYLVDHGADVKAVAKDKNTVADMANGPTRFGIPHPETVTMLEKLGSANSHNCRSDQCLVNPKDTKPATGQR